MTLFGYDQGVFGGVIVTPDFLETLNIVHKTSLQGTITALYDIGCFFGAIAAYFIGDWLGRKKTVLVGTTIMSVGGLATDHHIFSRPNHHRPDHSRYWQWHQYRYRSAMASRNIQGVLERKIDRHRVDPEHRWFYDKQLGHVWLLISARGAWLGESHLRSSSSSSSSFMQQCHGSQSLQGGWLARDDSTKPNRSSLDVEGTDIEDPYVQTELEEIKFANDYEKEHAVRIRDLLRGKVSANDPCTLRRLLLGMGKP